jgi:Domain of unknown function (DUF1906)
MKVSVAILAAFLFFFVPFTFVIPSGAQTPANSAHAYLGFDSNEYPGDSSLAELRKTFAFVGYWLNPPPGANRNPWVGKRATLSAHDFGFLVLFNGRLEAQLRHAPSPSTLGENDGAFAASAALGEGFPQGTILFLDQEEGGRLLDDQMAYVLGWVAGVQKRGFKAGVYCSGIAVNDGKNKTITTAENIREQAKSAAISFFVYNDACPPSPGCAYRASAPSESGTAFASVWQFAQSPRRKEYTARCASTYSKDGNCHPAAGASPGTAGALLDLDSATSPDPSHTR